MNTEATHGSVASNPIFAAIFLMFIMVTFLMAARDRRYVLFGYMLLIPLVTLPITAGRLAGIPGLSVQNIVIGLGVYALFLSRSRQTYMDHNLRVAFIVYWIVVSLTVLHGLNYLADLNKVPGFSETGIYEYFRAYLILPLLSWVSFVVAYRYAAIGSERSIEYLRYFGIAMLVYANVVLGSVIYYFSQGLNYTMVRSSVGDFIGIHSNDWSFGFAMAVPFLIAGAVSKEVFPKRGRIMFWLVLACSVTAILFSYSRSAYVALLLVSFGFALIKKKSLLLLFIPILAGLIFFGPTSVLDRAGFGIVKSVSEKSELDVNTVSSGRLALGKRALEIFTSDLEQISFGGGRLTFPRGAIKQFPGTTHPHNAYLELMLDSGALGFIPVFGVYLLMLSRFLKGMRLLRTSKYHLFYTAAAIGLGCRLILGLTNGSFFPLPNLLFMWQVSGFALGLLRYDMLQHLKKQPSDGKQ